MKASYKLMNEATRTMDRAIWDIMCAMTVTEPDETGFSVFFYDHHVSAVRKAFYSNFDMADFDLRDIESLEATNRRRAKYLWWRRLERAGAREWDW